MARWLVTGGAGFIGSNFVHFALRTRPHEILVFDKLTYAGNRRNLADAEADPRFSFVQGDIADRDQVTAVCRGFHPDAVINVAAETHVDRSIDGPRVFLETNERGTFELLEASRMYWERLDASRRENFRYLQVSTDEVYGSLGADGVFHETSPYAPNSPYAASKAAADHWVRAFHRTFGIPALVTHCSNNYGPYQFPEKLIPLMILNALSGEALPVYGDGLHVREWIHVEDHCSGIAQAVERGRVGEHYHIGTDDSATNLEVVEMVCDLVEEFAPAHVNAALRHLGARNYRALIEFVPDRPGHDRRYAVDSEKIRRELGWRAAHGLRSGLRDTVRWYVNNLPWCEALGYQRKRQGSPSLAANGA